MTIVAVALLSTASVAAIMIRKVLFLSSSSPFLAGCFSSSVLVSALSSALVSVLEGAGVVAEVGAVVSVFFGIYAVVAAVEAFEVSVVVVGSTIAGLAGAGVGAGVGVGVGVGFGQRSSTFAAGLWL